VVDRLRRAVARGLHLLDEPHHPAGDVHVAALRALQLGVVRVALRQQALRQADEAAEVGTVARQHHVDQHPADAAVAVLEGIHGGGVRRWQA
jgi:hypothetical protein